MAAFQVNGLAVRCPRPPDLTPQDFFFRGLIKDMIYVPPLPATPFELRTRVNSATEKVSPEMLVRVWKEIDYRWDVCRITYGSHIEHH